MKKAIFLAIGLGLLILLAVYGDAEKHELVQLPACATVDDGIHVDANGLVIVTSAKGATVTSTSISIQNAAPNHTYAAYSNYSGTDLAGTFTTNQNGFGKLRINGLYSSTITIWNHEQPDATLLLRWGCAVPPCD